MDASNLCYWLCPKRGEPDHGANPFCDRYAGTALACPGPHRCWGCGYEGDDFECPEWVAAKLRRP